MEDKKSVRTLLMSVLLSAPGPFVLGAGLLVGHSSTQISDFARRTTELFALVIALVIFIITEKNANMTEKEKERVKTIGNRCVGILMCVSGAVMLFILFTSNESDKGNVIPAFVIALLGAVVNSFFFFRYRRLFKMTGNSILGVQGRLYGAKSLVDICVTLTLFIILIQPGGRLAGVFDYTGTIIVSIYMTFCGIKTISETVIDRG
ncbi:MAG: cation transporter [Lachnospiraceae bacterium]|nr:cation transporter [Lachnospiraceae bacterium]